MSQFDLAMAFFAAHVLAAADEINKEYRMSLQVKGLADIVRQAKSAIDTAGVAAVRLRSSAEAVVNTIGQVDDMTRQLDAANADLTAAVGAMSNGGPPLETTGGSAKTSPDGTLAVPQPLTIPGSIRQVEAAYVAPPVVTASTIAAERAAAQSNS